MRHEAVATRLFAAPDAVDLEGNDLAVEQADDGLERPNPAQAANAPAHRFWPREAFHQLRHDLGNDLCGGAARSFHKRQVIGTLLVVAPLSLVCRRKPRRFEEALDRRIWRIDAWALPLFPNVRRSCRQTFDHRAQAPRSSEGLYLIELQAGFAKCVAEQPREKFSRTRLHPRWDLFGEQLKQKLSHTRCRRPQSLATQRSMPWQDRARARYKPASR